jgi:hypothetical protein
MSVRVRLALLLPLVALVGGCYSYHSGSIKVTIGNATFLPELSTKSGSIHLRLLESINGAVIYAPSNSYTTIAYTNYSHSYYFGIIESSDHKILNTTISPTVQQQTDKSAQPEKKQQLNNNSTEHIRKDEEGNHNNKANDENRQKVTADTAITKGRNCNLKKVKHVSILTHNFYKKQYSFYSLKDESTTQYIHLKSPLSSVSDPLVRDSRLTPSPTDMQTNNTTTSYSSGSKDNNTIVCYPSNYIMRSNRRSLHAFSLPSAETASVGYSC